MCHRIARARPTKILRAITFPKTNQLQTLFQFRLSVENIRAYNCFVLVWSFIKGKLPVQSLVPSLTLNNLIPFTTIFSSVYLSLNKIVPTRIGKNSTPPDWQKQYPSGLAKTIPLRVGKNSTPPDWQTQDTSGLAKIVPLRIGSIGTLADWQNWDPSGLAKLGPFRNGKNKTPLDWLNWYPSGLAKMRPFRIGKIETLPDWQTWDLSGFIKIAFQRLSKNSPDTLPDTFSDAIMLFELTRKGVFSFPRSFRIEAKPLI